MEANGDGTAWRVILAKQAVNVSVLRGLPPEAALSPLFDSRESTGCILATNREGQFDSADPLHLQAKTHYLKA